MRQLESIMVGPRTEHWRPRWCFGPLWMLAPEYLILSPCEHRGRGKTTGPKEMVSGAKRCGTPLYHYHLPPWMVLFAPTTMDTWQESSNPKLFPSSGMIVSRGGWVVGCQIQQRRSSGDPDPLWGARDDDFFDGEGNFRGDFVDVTYEVEICYMCA
jgi:hypothetical protein